MHDILIRGGTVVDGTGAAPVRADVRVRGGVIVEVAPDLAPGRRAAHRRVGRVRHARDHRHAHPPRRRDVVGPRRSTRCRHTATRRWCSATAATRLPRWPARSATRSSICSASSRTCRSRRFARGAVDVGGVAVVRRSPTGQPTTAHFGGYIGHVSLRTFVMGDDAWQRRGNQRRNRADGVAARRRPAGRRDGPVDQPLRQGPNPSAAARLLRRRRRIPRAARRARPTPPGDHAGDHPVQRPRTRRRGRRALRPIVPRGGRARPVAGHADERPRRR